MKPATGPVRPYPVTLPEPTICVLCDQPMWRGQVAMTDGKAYWHRAACVEAP